MIPVIKLYDFIFKVVLRDVGEAIDRLIDGTSPWLRRYQWLSGLISKKWKEARKYPPLGKAPTATMLIMCLMAELFFLVAVYCIFTEIRVPLIAQQPGVSLPKILFASLLTALGIGLSFGEGLRSMTHAGRLWRRASLSAKIKTALLFTMSSAGAAAMPLLT